MYAPSVANRILKTSGLIACYLLLAQSVSFFFSDSESLNYLWLACGISLAVVLVNGYVYLPAVFLAALSGNLVSGQLLFLSLTTAVCHAACVYAGVWLIKREGRFNSSVSALGDFLRVLAIAVIVGFSSGVVGQFIAYVAEQFLSNPVRYSFNQTWAGNALGIIILMPLVLVWRRFPRDWLTLRVAGEAALILFASIFVGQVVFLNWLHDSLGKTIDQP